MRSDGPSEEGEYEMADIWVFLRHVFEMTHLSSYTQSGVNDLPAKEPDPDFRVIGLYPSTSPVILTLRPCRTGMYLNSLSVQLGFRCER